MWGARVNPNHFNLRPQSCKPLGLTDAIVHDVRNAILQGRLYPGEHLCQRTLAAAHSTSKVPVREALMQLHSEGLLQHDRNRGYFVMRLSSEEARQIFVMRRWLETELLKSLCWPTSAKLDEFANLQRVVSRPPSVRDILEWFEALVELRNLLFGLSSEKVLQREAARIWVRTDRLHAFFRTEGKYEFLEPLRNRDRESLLAKYAAERDEAEATLADAQISMPGLWAISALSTHRP